MAAQSPTAAVTVVIPHYGDPAPTLALVDRLLTDPGDALAAVVVSDDASPTRLVVARHVSWRRSRAAYLVVRSSRTRRS